ncbi:MAG: hypothetical protein DMG72_11800, partial [Acidobacteria bacterium]
SGVWWIRYADTTGRIRREKAGTKSTALVLYRKRKTESLEGKKLPEKLRTQRICFSELAKSALEYSRVQKLSHRHDTCRMAFILRAFGSKPVDAIGREEISRWLDFQEEEQEWMPGTYNRYRALFSLIYRIGMENGKVATNPARLVPRRRENNARLRWLTPEEEKRLRFAIEMKWLYHLPEFDIALNTGLRLAEQYGLTIRWINLEQRIATVPRSKHGGTRHVPLNSIAMAALQHLWPAAKQRPDGRIFLSIRGDEALEGNRHWFNAALRDARIEDFHWHDLRHTFASRLVMAGVNLRTVQELMGHKSIQMTCRYVHLAPSHNLDAVERLATMAGSQGVATDTRTDTALLRDISDHIGALA